MVIIPLANAGMPLFSVEWSDQLLIFVPIVLVELLVHAQLLKINLGKSLLLTILANIISLIAGIGLIVVTTVAGPSVNANYAPLDYNYLPEYVITRVATLLGMLLVSIGVEYAYTSRLVTPRGNWLVNLSHLDRPAVLRSVVVANVLSYVLLSIVITYKVTDTLTQAQTRTITAEKRLQEIALVCPVVIDSEPCVRTLAERKSAYQELRSVYNRHKHPQKTEELMVAIYNMQNDIEKICAGNSQSALCKKNSDPF